MFEHSLGKALDYTIGQCTSCGQILGAGVTSHDQAECVRNIVRQEIEQYVARQTKYVSYGYAEISEFPLVRKVALRRSG